MSYIDTQNSTAPLLDKPPSLICPHCGVLASMNPVSFPRYELVHRFNLREVGVCYRCGSCNRSVFLRFNIQPANPIVIPERFELVERPKEDFELRYLPSDVGADFTEALTCHSNACWNAFAAMCRRTVQSAAAQLGAEGTSKVQNQIADLKDMGSVSDEVFTQLKQILLDGHDGAHPHLPKIDEGRAVVLLEIMKDVLYQLFVRPGKLREAAELRAKAIKSTNP